MKKLISALALALCLVFALSACTSTQNVDDVITEIQKEITITDITEKAASLIGADGGKSFKVGDNVFELYKFTDTAKLDEASTGSMVFNLSGFGEITVTCITKGKFVLTYTVKDTAVENAFNKAIK